MLKNSKISFNRGDILTKEMLESLYGYPRDYLMIRYDRYPDGILLGLDVTERDGSVWLTKGMAKLGGQIYMMMEDIDLSRWTAENGASKSTHYKLMFSPEGTGEERLERRPSIGSGSCERIFRWELRLVSESSSEEGLLLSHFMLDEKGKLDISDRMCWDMADCPYSVHGGVTFHPHIFRQAAEVLFGKKRRSAADFVMLSRILSDGILNKEVMRLYMKESGFSGEAVMHMEGVHLLNAFFQCLEKEPVEPQKEFTIAGIPERPDDVDDGGSLL